MFTLFYDFDGTLVDSAPGILESFRLVLERAGLSPTEPIDSRLIGPALPATMARLSGEQDPERLGRLVESFKQVYDSEGYKASRAYPQLKETLSILHQAGHRLVLVTNKRRAPTLAILRWLGIAGLFSAIYTPDSRTPVLGSKVETLRWAVAETTVAPERALMIGDSIDDAEAAAANGIAFVAASFGYGTAAVQQQFPRLATVAGLAELLPLVARLV